MVPASDNVRPVDIVTLAQVITSVTNLLFVIVLAAGYYFTWRVSQTTLEEMRAQRTAMGRPLVIVQEDYESLPELDVAIRNVSEGAARDIEFDFSVPIASSNGFVVSDFLTSSTGSTSCRRTVRSPATGTSSTLCYLSWSQKTSRTAFTLPSDTKTSRATPTRASGGSTPSSTKTPAS